MIKKPKNEIKDIILKFFYDYYKKFPNRKLSIDRIKKELKDFGLEENKIVDNLENLAENNWIIKEEEEYSIIKSGERVKIRVTYFKIGEKAIKHFEKSSKT